MLRTILSQKPPHHGARSTMNFHVMCFSTRKRQTASERVIFRSSLLANLKVFASSDIMVAGNPLRPANRRNAKRKACTLTPVVSSKCFALVDAHVNKRTYVFCKQFVLSVCFKPMWVKSGSSETRTSGRSGDGCGLYEMPSCLRQMTHLRRTFFTLSRPRKIQKRSLSVVSASRIPLCFTEMCVWEIKRSTK